MIYATPCSPRSSIRGRLGGPSWPSSSAARHIPSTYTAAHYTSRSARRSCAGHDAGISTRPGYATKRGARYPGGHGGRGTPAQPGRVYSRRSGLSGRRSWMIYATPCSTRSSIRGRLGGTSWPSSSAALHTPSTCTAAHYTGRSARRSCAGHDAGISTRPGYATKRGTRYPGGFGRLGTPAQPGRVSSRRSGLSGRRSWLIYATPCSTRSSIRRRLGGTSWPSSRAALHIPSTYTAAHYTGRSARRSCAGHDAGISRARDTRRSVAHVILVGAVGAGLTPSRTCVRLGTAREYDTASYRPPHAETASPSRWRSPDLARSASRQADACVAGGPGQRRD